MTQPTTLERAFDLARSGTCANLQDIRRRLKSEGYDKVEAHLAGPAIGKQLRRLVEAAYVPAESQSLEATARPEIPPATA